MSKVASSNTNNKINLNLCVKQHHKHILSNKDKKAIMKTNTPRLVTQFGPIWPTMGEREQLSNPLWWKWYQGVTKISLNAHKEQYLISTHFSSHSHSQWILRENTKWRFLILPMVKSHYPRCLQCFPSQENLLTKILNLKVTSFVIPSFSLFKLY